jgi:hypothetical protein
VKYSLLQAVSGLAQSVAVTLWVGAMTYLNRLIRQIRRRYSDDVPIELLEEACRRYQIYYHRRIEPQPELFYGAWGLTDARRQEFRHALDATKQEGNNS